MEQYSYIGKIFNEYNVKFPLENKLSIIIGENGTGKTKSLECLYDYLIENEDCKTIFLEEYRFKLFNKDDIASLKMLIKLQEIEIDDSCFNIDHNYYQLGEFLTSGKEQFLNMLYAASKCINGNLLIDLPESNLSLHLQGQLINTLLSFDLKRLVIVTHSPEILGNYYDKAIEIDDIVKL